MINIAQTLKSIDALGAPVPIKGFLLTVNLDVAGANASRLPQVSLEARKEIQNQPKKVAGDGPRVRLAREGFLRAGGGQSTAVRTRTHIPLTG